MEIQFNNHTISNLSEWGEIVFTGKKKVHWKKGRSAYSLADFIINENGVSEIKELVSPFINENFNLEKGIPELEVRFDKHGHGREHDLGIWGTTQSGKRIFIGVEAKVDESFGDTIASAYHKAKAKELNGEATNAPKRIEELLTFNFDKIKESDFQLRYQLLFYTAGTLWIDADIHIMLILVFKTDDYDSKKGLKNYNDLVNFLKKADAKTLGENTYQLNKELTLIYKEIAI